MECQWFCLDGKRNKQSRLSPLSKGPDVACLAARAVHEALRHRPGPGVLGPRGREVLDVTPCLGWGTFTSAKVNRSQTGRMNNWLTSTMFYNLWNRKWLCHWWWLSALLFNLRIHLCSFSQYWGSNSRRQDLLSRHSTSSSMALVLFVLVTFFSDRISSFCATWPQPMILLSIPLM
jgi:hypothetical protein